MKTRIASIVFGIGAGLVALVAFTGRAEAQVQICSNLGFALAPPGLTICNGAGNPVTVTANIRTSASLTLEQVFGAPASSLTVAFGDIDAGCLSPAVPGVTCALGAGSAVWYGDLQFRARMTGAGVVNAKATGVRPAAGSIPAGQLLDGVAAGQPATAYPISPTAPIDLRLGIGNGNTLFSRALGLRVLDTDAAGAWSGQAVYSLVIE